MSGRMWRRGPDGEMLRSEPAPEAPSPGADGAAGLRPRARLGIALRLGLRDSYDYLGSVVVLSFVFALLASAAMVGAQAVGILLFGGMPGMLPLVLTTLAACTGLVTVGGPLGAGLFQFARRAAAREEPDLFNLLWGFRHALRGSLGLATVQVFGLLILAANCWFYVSQRSLPVMILGAAMGYLALFWLAMSLYQWPLLVEQGLPVGRVIKKSALLVLDNIPFTLALLVLTLALTLALWFSVVGAVLLWPGVLAMFTTQATRELLRKYEVLPPDPTLDPLATETHELAGHGWHE